MFHRIILVSVCCISFAGFASADLLVKSGQKVAFMGDSITAGGWDLPGGYVKLTAQGLATLGAEIVPIPAGVGGNTSRDMVARLDRDVLSKKPDWLTLSCGVNDVWHGKDGCTLEEYEKNITSIVDQAEKAGIKVLILTSTPIGEDLTEDNNKKLIIYNDFLRQFAAQRQLPVAEENGAFQEALKGHDLDRPYLTMDGVHPNTDGSQVMATALLAAFGATPAQITQVQQAWTDAPGDAFAHAGFGFGIDAPISIKQYDALRKIAVSRKVPMRSRCSFPSAPTYLIQWILLPGIFSKIPFGILVVLVTNVLPSIS